MKSIISVCLLFTTATVWGQAVELHRIVGDTVRFPAAVEKGGSLMHGGVTVGDVTSGRFTTPRQEKFSGRLQWDSSTGLFSLSGLKMEDMGEYKVQNTEQKINTVFQLNVHKDNVPVSKPHVSVTHNEYPCTLLCTVDRGTGVTLSWSREGEKKQYVHTHPLNAPDLKLPVPVEKIGTYTCEAKNSVSNETSAPLTVGPHCTAHSGSNAGMIVGIVISVIAVAAAFAGGFYCGAKKRDPTSLPTQLNPTYSAVTNHEQPVPLTQ